MPTARRRSATTPHPAKMARNPEATQFGSSRMAPSAKTAAVADVFARVARRYDRMNDVMSLGIHRHWKDIFVALVAPRAGEQILDVAGGTGDITRRLLRATAGQAQLTVADLSPQMLAEGQRRTLNAGWPDVAWVTADAAALPFANQSFDAVTIAFGLRNVTRIDDALAEFARVLRPGGCFYCLEFSPSIIRPLVGPYGWWRDRIIPQLGAWLAKDRAAYQYLAESIRGFPAPAALQTRIAAAGFRQTGHYLLAGGIVAIHWGQQ